MHLPLLEKVALKLVPLSNSKGTLWGRRGSTIAQCRARKRCEEGSENSTLNGGSSASKRTIGAAVVVTRLSFTGSSTTLYTPPGPAIAIRGRTARVPDSAPGNTAGILLLRG